MNENDIQILTRNSERIATAFERIAAAQEAQAEATLQNIRLRAMETWQPRRLTDAQERMDSAREVTA